MEINQVLDALDFEPEADGVFALGRLKARIACLSAVHNPACKSAIRLISEREGWNEGNEAQMMETFVRGCLVSWDMTIDGKPAPTTWPEAAELVFRTGKPGMALYEEMSTFAVNMKNFRAPSKKKPSLTGGTSTKTRARKSRASSRSAKAAAKPSPNAHAAT